MLTLLDWITGLMAVAFCLCVAFTPYALSKKQTDVQAQIWVVECDGITIQYHSPWPMAPADVCASITD